MNRSAVNPFLPSYEYIPDGEPYVFGDRVYLYGSHDRFNGTAYCMNNYVCWSAPVGNLADWHYEGVIFNKTKDPLCDNPDDRFLFAPDVQLGNDGRYYLYYAFDFLGVMSVAVCDTPAGEYDFYGHISYSNGTLLGRREGDPFQFDPGVLVDDDGRVFLYSGFCPRDTGVFRYFNLPEPLIEGGMVIELEQDMKTVKKRPVSIFPSIHNSAGTSFEGHEFFEAPSMRKIGEKYYFIYSSIHGHELCYATSSRPEKDFIFGGTIVSNGDIYFEGRSENDALNYTGNNHGSMVEIEGQWYVFYHRQTNRHQFSRQACAERIMISDDGSIDQVEMTSCGLNIGPLPGKGCYEARIACNLLSGKGAIRYEFGDEVQNYHPYFTQDGDDREDTPNQYIANICDGSVAGFKSFDIRDLKAFSIEERGSGTGKLAVLTELEGAILAEISIEPADEWTTVEECVEIPDGVRALFFKYTGDNSMDFKSFTLT